MECKGDSVEKVGSRSLKKNHLAVFDPQIDCGRLGFWIDPSRDMGGVFMAQVLPFVDPKALQAFYDFETAAYQTTSG